MGEFDWCSTLSLLRHGFLDSFNWFKNSSMDCRQSKELELICSVEFIGKYLLGIEYLEFLVWVILGKFFILSYMRRAACLLAACLVFPSPIQKHYTNNINDCDFCILNI